MPEEITREIMKLEVRINNFLKKEKKFINGLRGCLEKFRELNNELPNPESTFTKNELTSELFIAELSSVAIILTV